jgi:hypothetical protein
MSVLRLGTSWTVLPEMLQRAGRPGRYPHTSSPGYPGSTIAFALSFAQLTESALPFMSITTSGLPRKSRNCQRTPLSA